MSERLPQDARASMGDIYRLENETESLDARLTALEEHREAGRYVTAEVQITAQEEQEFPPTETEPIRETASIESDTETPSPGVHTEPADSQERETSAIRTKVQKTSGNLQEGDDMGDETPATCTKAQTLVEGVEKARRMEWDSNPYATDSSAARAAILKVADWLEAKGHKNDAACDCVDALRAEAGE